MKPHSRVEVFAFGGPLGEHHGATHAGAWTRETGVGNGDEWMATRERRLAEFDGNGDPPADQAVQVLCEDHSGTYQLPFACRFVDGEWRNDESGGALEATVVGWRLSRP